MENNKQCNLLFRDCCQGENLPTTNNSNILNENNYNQLYYNDEGNYINESNEIPIITVKGDQPIFNIPVYQDKYIRDKIVEVPKYEFQDVIQPKIYSQETKHDVPNVELVFKEKTINIPQEKIIETPLEVDVPVGYTPVYSPTWDVREIPRPIPKYEGEQKIIEVEVPQIKYIDKYVEKEVVVDIKEKIIPKITEIEKQVDVVKYQWKQQYQDVPVCKYIPKIDVELDCPPPLIVPYPEVQFQSTAQIMNPNQKAADIPSEYLLKNTNISSMSNMHVDESVKKSLLDIAKLTPKKTQMKKKNKWPFCSFYQCNKEDKSDADDIDPQTGYPKSMPKDFSAFFKKDLNTVKKQMGLPTDNKSTVSSNQIEKSPVNPTVEYLGKIDKPPVDGGKLDSISFKLHAIEVHQFIPVPNLPKPKFLDLVPPEQIEKNDISGLKNIFGSVPDGWVDPNITGFIAPMMNDILHGNVQPQSPLFNQISIADKKKSKSYISLTEDYKRSEHYMQDNISSKNSINYNFNPNSSMSLMYENGESYDE